MKEENEYLYKQIELLHTEIKSHTDTTEQLSLQNSKLLSLIHDEKTEMENYKRSVSYQEGICRNYLILQGLYFKTKEEKHLLLSRNKLLQLHNERLVAELSRLVDEVPIQPKLVKKQSQEKEPTNGGDKENCSSSSTESFSPASEEREKMGRFTKSSREDNDFFDLSPE
jgi:hypothetical protein